jgi:PAS domain S-box-containing protein
LTAENPIKSINSGITDRHLLAALEGAGLGVWTHEKASGHIRWSEFLCRLLGYSIPNAPTTLASWMKLVHPADRQAVQTAITSLRREGELEFQMRSNNGSWSRLHLRLCPVETETNDAPQITMGTIAHNVHHPSAPQPTHPLYRVLNSLPSHIAVIDHRGVIVAVNQPWRDFFSANLGSAARQEQYAYAGINYLDACQSLLGDEEIGAVKAGIQAVLAHELSIFSTEYPCHSPDQQRWFSMTAMPLDDGSGGAVIAHTVITEQKLAEQALKAQLQLTDEIIDSAPGIFYLLDDTGSILRWNKNLEAISGYDSAAISRIGPLGFFNPETKLLVSKAIEETFINGQASLDALLVTKDGRSIPHYFSGRSIKLDDKQYVIGFGVDMTEQQQSASELELHRNDLQAMVDQRTRQLQHSEARMRAILHASPLGIGVVVERQLREVNEAMTTITGYSAEEMLGRSARLLYPSEAEFSRVGEEKYAQIRAHGIGTIETVWRQKNGASRHILMASAMIDPEDPSLGSSFTAFDITERKLIEEALEANEKFLRAITDALPCMVSQWDKDGCCRFANRAYQEWFGKTPTQMQGKTIRHVLGEKLFLLNQPHIEAVIRGERQQFERTLKKPSGEISHLLIDYIPEHTGDNVIGFYAMVTDVTLVKLAEAKLEESQQLLRQLLIRQDQIRESERNHLARELHDELGQLLTGMHFMVSALQLSANVTTSQTDQFALELKTYLDQTQAVVRRITRDLHPAQLEEGLLPALEALATEFSSRSGITCRLTLSGADPQLNITDATSIFRIAQESLTNVARHAQAGSVSMHIESTEEFLNLKIEDDGRGFDTALLRSHGLSFGLIGMHERAALLDATLKIVSTPGYGTNIEVGIPLK